MSQTKSALLRNHDFGIGSGLLIISCSRYYPLPRGPGITPFGLHEATIATDSSDIDYTTLIELGSSASDQPTRGTLLPVLAGESRGRGS